MKKLVVILASIIMCSLMAFSASAQTTRSETYAQLMRNATPEELAMLRNTVYWESERAAEGSQYSMFYVNCAVVETVLNRVLSSEHPSTIKSVLVQPGAFVGETKYNYKASESLEDAIAQYFNCCEDDLVLPNERYCYFATKKQSLGKGHVWIGRTKQNGRPYKPFCMYFCEGK